MCSRDCSSVQEVNELKIAIDGYEANTLQRLGSSQVGFELIKHFEKIDHKNEYTIFLPSKPLDDLPGEREGFKYEKLIPKRFWTRIALPLALFRHRKKYDLIFSPTHYIPRFSPIKRVVTIFDLSFLHFPEMFKRSDLWQLKNWTKFSVLNADHIITISSFSKKDIVTQYNIKPEKITVAYPGYNRDVFYPSSKLSKYGSYIIYIGTVQPRKNLIRLMEAVSRIEGLNLLIVGKTKGGGKQGWMYEETLKTPMSFDIEERVKFLGFVPTEELVDLIRGAQAFVQPSLYEGFGIPVVEAMACGCPVLVSNVSSLPEVVGGAGLTFDPYSIDQIEQAIRVIISDKKLRQKLSKASLIQSQKFSYDKMAKTILKSFEQLV